MTQRKPALRAELTARRDAAPAAERKAASVRIMRLALEYCRTLGARRVAAYCSYRSEVETDSLSAELLNAGLELFLPRVVGEGKLELRRVRNLETDLEKGKLGIAEPIEGRCPVFWPDSTSKTGRNIGTHTGLDVIFVPGCGFDAGGNRLGTGQGYYDRLLAPLRVTRKVGLAFSFQQVEEIPAEGHDIPMDAVITEEGILEFAGR